MAVSYKRLFHLMIDKGVTNAELMEKAGFSANIITRLKRDHYVALDSIEKSAMPLTVAWMIFWSSYLRKRSIRPMIDTKKEQERNELHRAI